jgi:hypothetical protein
MEMLDEALDFRLLNDFQRDFPLCSAPLPNWRPAWGLPRAPSCGCWRRCAAKARSRASARSSRPSASAPARWQRWRCHRRNWLRRRGGQSLSRGQPQLRARAPLQPLVRRHGRFGRAPAGRPGRHRTGVPAGRCSAAAAAGIPHRPRFCARRQERRPPGAACAGSFRTADAARRIRTSSGDGPAGRLAAVHSAVLGACQPVGCDESEVLERIRRWCAEGIIKRFGVIVRHHELGYTANAMLVHDIPDAGVAPSASAWRANPG